MVKKADINGLDIAYKTDYRNVKYPRLEFKTGGLVLILPKGYQDEQELINKHKAWVHKKSSIIQTAIKDARKRQLNLDRSEIELKDIIYRSTKEFSKSLKTRVKRIYLKHLKSKWGSCSSKGNLTFNLWLRYLPADLIRYVVLHEVAHLIEKRHKDRFWSIVGHHFRDYPENEKRLLSYWFLVQEFIKKKRPADDIGNFSF